MVSTKIRVVKKGRSCFMLLSKPEYEAAIASTRDERMSWWRDARFGMFIHFGVHSLLEANEWVMALENYEVDEYKKLAKQFKPEVGCCRRWAKLAKEAGMKYMVLTTRHHEGFSLWDSKVNPYNSVNYGPKRDIVKEFVEACREFDLKIGFYSSLMDWQHEDSYTCAYDSEAKHRFTKYIKELNRELMTNYGKIDILWYDVARPMETFEGWNSLELNQMVRELQPHILINNRSKLDEDFGTPEEHLTAEKRDWEACMTFNGISWGYLDSEQVVPYSYSPQQIIRMLNRVTQAGGNLLLNIGPMPDGSIPKEAYALKEVGNWLEHYGEAYYGKKEVNPMVIEQKGGARKASGICDVIEDGMNYYIVNLVWPKKGELHLGGFYEGEVKSITDLNTGKEVDFKQTDRRITLMNLPEKTPDSILGMHVLKMEFKEYPKFTRCSAYPQLSLGFNPHK